MLVAMLRSAGIPAYMAFFDSGPGEDARPGTASEWVRSIMPSSMCRRRKTPDALWIDATAKFDAVGTLPYMDEGRLALVIKDGTTELTRTPKQRHQRRTC